MPKGTTATKTADINDTDLDACIKLVMATSYWAQNHDYKGYGTVPPPKDHKQSIRKRMNGGAGDNSWVIWHFKPDQTVAVPNPTPIVCCFFQRYRKKGNMPAMCMGIDQSIPLNNDQDCANFLSTNPGGVAGDGTPQGGMLRSLFKTNYSSGVFIIDQPLYLASAAYNARMSTLFSYMQRNSGFPSYWTLQQRTDYGTFDDPLWGGNGLNIWQLIVS
jgi:hypothetical protein